MQKDIIPQDCSPEFGQDLASVLKHLQKYAKHLSSTKDVRGLDGLWDYLQTLESVTSAFLGQPRFHLGETDYSVAGKAVEAFGEAMSYALQLVAASMHEAEATADEHDRNIPAGVILSSMIRWGADPKHLSDEAAKLAE